MNELDVSKDKYQKLYVKLIFDNEGVVYEKEVHSQAQAEEMKEVFIKVKEAIDPEDDYHTVVIHNEPAGGDL